MYLQQQPFSNYLTNFNFALIEATGIPHAHLCPIVLSWVSSVCIASQRFGPRIRSQIMSTGWKSTISHKIHCQNHLIVFEFDLTKNLSYYMYKLFVTSILDMNMDWFSHRNTCIYAFEVVVKHVYCLNM